jgi:hypothetical protein
VREAAVPGYRLAKARGSTKVLISLGLLGLLFGLMSAALLTITKTGLSPSSVQEYYLGTASGENELGALTGSTARPLAELAEVTHLHLMGGSMLLFFLCHLLSLCEVPDSLRTILYLISFGTFLSTFGLPWLIVYAHPLFSYAFGPSILSFLASLVVVSGIPLKEMWVTQ